MHLWKSHCPVRVVTGRSDESQTHPLAAAFLARALYQFDCEFDVCNTLMKSTWDINLKYCHNDHGQATDIHYSSSTSYKPSFVIVHDGLLPCTKSLIPPGASPGFKSPSLQSYGMSMGSEYFIARGPCAWIVPISTGIWHRGTLALSDGLKPATGRGYNATMY